VIGTLEQGIMAKKLRIAAIFGTALAAVVAASLWSAYRAARQVRPFYQQALELDHAVLERGRQELESRATALYSDARNSGTWQAVFTAEQVNGWLASQLAEVPADKAEALSESVRDPRIAISPGLLTLGFTTNQGSVDTVVSVDASVFLTEEGDVAVRLMKVQAGTLPLPVAIVADEIATACENLSLPILWSEHDGRPVAMIKIGNADAANGPRWFIDAIELTEGELFVSGHTDVAKRDVVDRVQPNLEDYELRLSAPKSKSMLEIAQRAERAGADSSRAAD
jgi:hypothetical protein